jgi:hypothetical protein
MVDAGARKAHAVEARRDRRRVRNIVILYEETECGSGRSEKVFKEEKGRSDWNRTKMK